MVAGKESVVTKKLRENLIHLADSQCVSLPENFVDFIPRKWEKHGDLIVFPSTAFQEDFWHNFDNESLYGAVARHLNVKRVARQDKIRSNDFRSPNVSMLLGTDPWAVHTDNKIRYTFNITKCMFSSGNITEKMRMGRLKCAGETVVDLFAGIGYFTLPILVHGGADHVISCEWNPDAVEALKKNLQLNRVSERCTVLAGDNRQLAPTGVADRVLLGLIPTAEGSYGAACRALNPATGGWMHVHANVESAEEADVEPAAATDQLLPSCNRTLKPAWLQWALETCETLNNLLSGRWAVQVEHVERVKSYAPHIDHLVADIHCRPLGGGG